MNMNMIGHGNYQQDVLDLDIRSIKEETDMEMAYRKLRYFVRGAWPQIEGRRVLKWGWHLDCITDHLEYVSKGEITRLLINLPPRHCKLISDESMTYTSNGWRKHGDLRVGDYVFTPYGEKAKIVRVSPKDYADYKITFTNGEVINCNGDHLWKVYNRGATKWETRTTESMADLKVFSGGRAVFQLPNIEKPLPFDEKDLILHPYFLGAWLGDGTKTRTVLTICNTDLEILEEIEDRCGYVPMTIQEQVGCCAYGYTHQGIIQRIKEIGVFDNKHIPDVYKYSSVEQRLQLLAGLIDTDGHVEKETSRVRLSTFSKEFADDIYEVCMSLGLRPYICSGDALGCFGYAPTNDLYYHVGFQPTLDIPCAVERKKITRLIKQRRIGIKSIKKLKVPKQGNCISIDKSHGLYLVGKSSIPTHNSTIVSVCWSAWNWLENPWLQFLFAAYGSGLTTRDNVKCRHIIQSLWYKKLIKYVLERNPDDWYNGPLELSGDQNAKVRYMNNYGGYRIATSVDGAATGEGGDHIVCDDPNNVKQVESDVIRQGVNTWFDESMQSRLNDPNKSTFVIVQQRTHENDLSGHVKSKYGDALEIEDGYHMLILPGRYEGRKLISTVLNWNDPREELDEPLWKEQFDDKALARLEKSLTDYAKAGQIQQRPAPRGGGLIKIDNFKIVEQIPYKITRYVRYWDKAGSEKKGNRAQGPAYTAGVLMAEMRCPLGTSFWIILHVRRGRWELDERELKIRAQAEIDRIRYGHVEIFFEQEPGSGAKDSAKISIRNMAGFVIEADRPTGDKIFRAEPFAVQVNQGNVYLLQGEWNQEYLDEAESFPVTRYKDQIDASTGAFNKIANKPTGGVW